MTKVRLGAALCVMLLMLPACSLRSMVDKLMTPEDRAFVTKFNDDMRAGNVDGIVKVLSPDIIEASVPQIVIAKTLYPESAGTTEVVTVNKSFNSTNGRTENRKEFVLVTGDGKRWTRLEIIKFSDGGPEKVIGWDVKPFDEAPPELAALEAWDRYAPMVIGISLLVVVGFIALIWYLVRRSRRVHKV